LAVFADWRLNIPAARNDILGPINSVIDALWDLEAAPSYPTHKLPKIALFGKPSALNSQKGDTKSD
jgi:hypothetical protein